jgi:hypothetical protein
MAPETKQVHRMPWEPPHAHPHPRRRRHHAHSGRGPRPGRKLRERRGLVQAELRVAPQWQAGCPPVEPVPGAHVQGDLAAVPAKSRSAVLGETHAAMRTLGAKTGMSFTYRGATGEVPRKGSGAKQTADIIIAYTTPAKTNYPLSGPTAGVGGASTGNLRQAGGTNDTVAFTKGFLVIDTPDMLRLFKPGMGAGVTRGNLLLHELGHVVGLGHVTKPGLMMNGSMTRSTPNGYAGGDQAGLAKLGRKAGCLTGF